MSEIARPVSIPEPPQFTNLRGALDTYRRTADYMPLVKAAEVVLEAFDAQMLAVNAQLAQAAPGGQFVAGPAGMVAYIKKAEDR